MPSEHSGSQPASIDISLSHAASYIWSRRSAVLKITLLATVLALAISLVLPKKYESTVILMPPSQSGSHTNALFGAGLSALSSLSGGALSLKNPNDMYAGMLHSQSVEDAIIHAEDLMHVYRDKRMSDARKDLEKNLTIDTTSKDNLIYIKVIDKSPQRAAAMANDFVAQFRDLSMKLALSEGSERRRFYESQISTVEDQLSQAEEALLQQEKVSGVLQPNVQGQVLIETTAQLRAQITAKEVELRGIQTYATQENPQVEQLRQEIGALNAQLGQVLKGQSSSDDLLTQAKAPKAALDYERKLRDVKYYEGLYTVLEKEAEVARLDEAQQDTTIKVVDPGLVPDKKSSPRLALNTLLGALLGLFGSLSYFAFQAIRSQYRESLSAIRLAKSAQGA